MNNIDPTLISVIVFAAGYVLRAWDARGNQQSNSTVAIAELRTELSSLRREVERLIDQFAADRYDDHKQRSFGRRRND